MKKNLVFALMMSALVAESKPLRIVRLDLAVRCSSGEVRDGATGEKLADLGPGANRVMLTLGPDRLARLLYVGCKCDSRMNASR